MSGAAAGAAISMAGSAGGGGGGGGGGFGAAMFANSAFQAITSIFEGYNQSKIAGYNAMVIESRGKLVDIKKSIEAGQYTRLAGSMMSKGVANIAGSGLGFGGSKMAVMLENQRQIEIDKAIGAFGFDIEKSDIQYSSSLERLKGKVAVQEGYANAFSSLMQGGSKYAQYKGYLDTEQGAKRAGRT